eukprot:6999604-Pyramimonas_sp.AAC.1
METPGKGQGSANNWDFPRTSFSCPTQIEQNWRRYPHLRGQPEERPLTRRLRGRAERVCMQYSKEVPKFPSSQLSTKCA